jgi:hypothetical protein
MKNFVVLFKPIEANMQADAKNIYADYVQLDYLMQEAMKKETGKWVDIKDHYEIDQSTVSFQNINGRLCVVMIAYRK